MNNLSKNVLIFCAGALFAAGLALGGMTQPQRVIGFLDIFGAWDPTLAGVMGGALVTYGLWFRSITRRSSPLFATRFTIPTRRDFTPSLVGGSALFGAGWGLGGFCPGPGMASLATGAAPVLTFVAAMLIGMTVQRILAAQTDRPSAIQTADAE